LILIVIRVYNECKNVEIINKNIHLCPTLAFSFEPVLCFFGDDFYFQKTRREKN